MLSSFEGDVEHGSIQGVQEQFPGSLYRRAVWSDWWLHTWISRDCDTAEQDRWGNDIEKATLVLHNKSKLLPKEKCFQKKNAELS